MEREIYVNKTLKMRKFGYTIASIFSLGIIGLTLEVVLGALK